MTVLQELGLISHYTNFLTHHHFAVITDEMEWREAIKAAQLEDFNVELWNLRNHPNVLKWRQWIEANRVCVSTYGCSDYPPLWRELQSPPLVFYYVGQPVWIDQPLIAVVGSRNPMQDSVRWLDWHFKDFLKSVRLPVVSGGARGIDMKAHAMTVQSRLPTVAAMPVGIMSRYPSQFVEIESEILRFGGAVFSQFPPDWPLHRGNFQQRNLLIAGMSKMVLIAEARRRSGSLITAVAARDLGKTLATIPCSPLRSSGRGSLDLLADGATLLRDSSDLAMAWSRANGGLLPQEQLQLSGL